MKTGTIIFTIILSAGISVCATGQSREELDMLAGGGHKDEKRLTDHRQEGGNELQQISSGLFWIYKKFISSQDVVSCNFHPSCSEYAIQAIRKQGIFLGLLNAFDRMSRCNGLSPERYEVYPGTKLLYDPVEREDK